MACFSVGTFDVHLLSAKRREFSASVSWIVLNKQDFAEPVTKCHWI